jgi:hypothetical protein
MVLLGHMPMKLSLCSSKQSYGDPSLRTCGIIWPRKTQLRANTNLCVTLYQGPGRPHTLYRSILSRLNNSLEHPLNYGYVLKDLHKIFWLEFSNWCPLNLLQSLNVIISVDYIVHYKTKSVFPQKYPWNSLHETHNIIPYNADTWVPFQT